MAEKLGIFNTKVLVGLYLGMIESRFPPMPPHPTFDDNTFNALEAYFKAIMPYTIEAIKEQ
jgi:hypothetical protein